MVASHKKKAAHVSCYNRPHDGWWVVEVAHAGKKTFQRRKTEHAAKQLANSWRVKFGLDLVEVPPMPQRSKAKTANFWDDKLREAAQAIMEEPADEDLRAAGEIIAKLAAAAAKTIDRVGDEAQDELSAHNVPETTADVSKLTTQELEELAGGQHAAVEEVPQKVLDGPHREAGPGGGDPPQGLFRPAAA